MTSSALAELRELAPHRPLNPYEAQRVAQLQAARLLQMQGITEPPVPEQAIELLPRITVAFNHGPVSGSVCWIGSQWLITIDAREAWVRQRWTIAHEFKHALDAPLMATIYPATNRLSCHQRQERAAHQFAAALLMPKAWVKAAYFDHGITNVISLARRFRVSAEAMRIRLEELGITQRTLGGVR